jgi:hypothetical protein
MKRRASSTSASAVFVVAAAALVLPARDGRAEIPPPAPSPWYVQAKAGPAFATFFPIDDGGISEHLSTNGTQLCLGVGRGFDLGRARVDVGLRVQHLRLEVQGSYSLVEVNDSYHANYDYLAGLLDIGLASRRPQRVNAFVTATLGTARLFSNRQGEPLRNHQLPRYGSLEGGLPPLLLQPLVENAVLHGVAGRAEGGALRIAAFRAGPEVRVRVDDDGPGPGASGHRGTGTSLRDLRRRLDLLFGAAGCLSTGPNAEGGFTALLALPAGGGRRP